MGIVKWTTPDIKDVMRHTFVSYWTSYLHCGGHGGFRALRGPNFPRGTRGFNSTIAHESSQIGHSYVSHRWCTCTIDEADTSPQGEYETDRTVAPHAKAHGWGDGIR